LVEARLNLRQPIPGFDDKFLEFFDTRFHIHSLIRSAGPCKRRTPKNMTSRSAPL
jgi:hypothetical protein